MDVCMDVCMDVYIYIYLYIHIYYLRYENICWNLWVPVKNNYRMYSSSTKLIDIIGLHRRRRPATAAHRRPPTPTAQPTTWHEWPHVFCFSCMPRFSPRAQACILPSTQLGWQIPLLAYAEQQNKCTMRPTQKWRMCNQSFLSNKCNSCH